MKKSKKSTGPCLSEDIIEFAILPRLPAKTLLRLQCTSRKWHNLIARDCSFIRMQSRKASDSPSLSYIGGPSMTFLSIDLRSTGIQSLSCLLAGKTKIILASCNGLLCIFSHHTYSNLYIVNPATMYLEIINKPMQIDFMRCYGLAVDVREPIVSYKLIILHRTDSLLINNGNKKANYGFKFFSSETGTWKLSAGRIELSYHIWPEQGAMYVGGALYWKYGDHVLWFDPKEEQCGLLPLPSNNNESKKGVIGESNSELSYTRIVAGEIQIWTMECQSFYWCKRHCIKLEMIVEQNLETFASICHKMQLRNRRPGEVLSRRCKLRMLPFEGGNVVWLQVKGVVFSYCMETGEARKHGAVESGSNFAWFPYKNSLISFKTHRWKDFGRMQG